MHTDILRRSGMWIEGNDPKSGEPRVGFTFTTMLQRTGSFLVRDLLAKNKVTTLEHPPYSCGLTAADFHLFPRLKSVLRGRRFYDIIDIIKNAQAELKRLSQNGFQE